MLEFVVVFYLIYIETGFRDGFRGNFYLIYIGNAGIRGDSYLIYIENVEIRGIVSLH